MINFDFITKRDISSSAFEINFDFGSTLFNILVGSSNIITAIWADVDASRSNGKFYVSSYGEGSGFSIVDLNLKMLYDRYTKTTKGRANEALKQEDIVSVV